MTSRAIFVVSWLPAIALNLIATRGAGAVPILNARGDYARPDGLQTHWRQDTYIYIDGNGVAHYEFRDPQYGTPPTPGYTLWRTTTGTDTHLSSPFFPGPNDVPSGRWFLDVDDALPFNSPAEVTVVMGLKVGNYAGNLGPMRGFSPGNVPLYTGGTFGPDEATQFTYSQTSMVDASQLSTVLPADIYDLSDWAGATGTVAIFKVTAPLSQLIPARFDVGDYNSNNLIDAPDIDAMFSAPGGPALPGTANSKYDLNFDGIVNPVAGSAASDTDFWVNRFAMTRYGDANLDRSVNFDDLLVVAQNYGSTTGGWAQGNFNGADGITFDDLLVVAQNYGVSTVVDVGIGTPEFQADWRLAMSMVPEPTSVVAMFTGALALLRRQGR